MPFFCLGSELAKQKQTNTKTMLADLDWCSCSIAVYVCGRETYYSVLYLDLENVQNIVPKMVENVHAKKC